MSVRAKFWSLIACWMVLGQSIMLVWAIQVLDDGETFVLFFSLMIFVAALNYWLIRCPICNTSAFFVRKHIYGSWPEKKCRVCGTKIM